MVCFCGDRHFCFLEIGIFDWLIKTLGSWIYAPTLECSAQVAFGTLLSCSFSETEMPSVHTLISWCEPVWLAADTAEFEARSMPFPLRPTLVSTLQIYRSSKTFGPTEEAHSPVGTLVSAHRLHLVKETRAAAFMVDNSAAGSHGLSLSPAFVNLELLSCPGHGIPCGGDVSPLRARQIFLEWAQQTVSLFC